MKKNNAKKETEITFEGSKNLVMHNSKPDMQINKADLIIYLGYFRDAVVNKTKDGVPVALLRLAFVFSFFLTSSFKNFNYITSNHLLSLYIFLAGAYMFYEIQKALKKDDSKYKKTSPEEMADIIESNCKKK